MSDFVTKKCDVCQKVKGEANKWLKIVVYSDPTSDGLYISSIITGSEIGETYRYEDICSDTCLQKRLAEVVEKIRSRHNASMGKTDNGSSDSRSEEGKQAFKQAFTG